MQPSIESGYSIQIRCTMGIFDEFKSKLGAVESPSLVYLFAKLIGLAPFTLKDNRLRPPTISELFYSTVMAVIHLLLGALAIAYTVLRVGDTHLSRGTQIWAVARYVTYVSPLFVTLAVFISSHSKVVRLINKLCDTRNRLEALGIQENPRKLFGNVNVTTVIGNAIIVTMCVLAGLMEANWYIVNSIAYGIGCWFNLNLLLAYVQVLICIRQRFVMMNERLSVAFVRHRMPRIEENGTDSNRFELIREAEALHLDLSELVVEATEIFTLPILLNSFQFFSVMVVSGQWVYSSVLPRSGPGSMTIDTFTALMSPLLRIAIALGQMMMIAHASATTCQRVRRGSVVQVLKIRKYHLRRSFLQGNATRARIIEMWNESKPAELRDEVCKRFVP